MRKEQFECYFFRKLRISDDLQKHIFLLTITLTISVLIAKVVVSKIYVFGKHFACHKSITGRVNQVLSLYFLYRFKKRIRMCRIKNLIAGHDSYQIICL